MCRPVLVLLLCSLLPVKGRAQNSAGARIEIIGTDRLVYDPLITKAQRLLGNVRLKHDNALMRCDSAYLFEDQTMNAFGHVMIDQDTLHITGDRLDYVGQERMATLKGNVHLSDPGMELTSSALTYSLRERIARYSTGATIVSRREQNTLTSRKGAYLALGHRFIFSDEVRLRHPERTIDADTLHYTTTTGVAEFYGPTRITQGTTVMFTERGGYDTRKEQGRFTRGGRIVDGTQELIGDSLHYDKRLGLGRAWGHVMVIDTANDMVVRGDVGQHAQHDERSLITGRAELSMVMGGDTLFLHADTLFAGLDSAKQRHILARRHVRFFKRDMQGVCDTMTYAERDSLITLVGNPFLWSGPDQISGRYIRILMREGRAHRLYVDKDALLANSVDSVVVDSSTAFFDQVAGSRITGYFLHDELTRVVAEGNSRTVYFAQEKDALGVERTTGMNRVDCSRIEVGLTSGKVSSVSFITKPDATLYPLSKAPPGEMRMKGFVWNAAARPLDRSAIFN
jgi:lipopolysaccharide export system protein LptA